MFTSKDRCYQGKSPKFHEESFVASGAEIVGDVTVGRFASFWHNVSARGDVNRIEVGEYSNVQDNAVLHVSDDGPCILGDFVTVGHGAIVHAATVEDHCLIGMGATVLDHAVIGRGSIVAAGAVVTAGTVVPPNSLVVGVPGKIIPRKEDQVPRIHAQAVKYKTLWTLWYGIHPDAEGEVYEGEKIV